MNKLETVDDVRRLIEESIEDYGYEKIIIFDNPDYASAFIGVTNDNRAVYDFDKMIEHLMIKDGMTDIEAIEFIEYNTIRALPYYGDKALIILYPLSIM